MIYFFDVYKEFITRDPRSNRKNWTVTSESLTKRCAALLPIEMIKGKKILDLGSCIGAMGQWCLENGAEHYTGVEIQKEFRDISQSLLSKHHTNFTIVESMEEINPGDENKVFYKLSVPKKLAVMIGGPFMNLILAFIFFSISFTAIGIPVATNQIKQVVTCLPKDVDVLGDCLVGTTPSPALAAGLKENDQIIEFDGVKITNWEELALAIQKSKPGNIPIKVLRNKESVTLSANIILAERPNTNSDRNENKVSPYLGISPAIMMDRQSIVSVFVILKDISVGTFQVIMNFPNRVAQLFSSAFLGQERDPEGLVGIVGVTRVGGEIAAADIPGLWRFATLLNLAGGLNMALFLFNLLPLLPLDGGHVAGAIYEGIRRQFAKLRGKVDPGPADTSKMLPVAYSVAILLIGLSMLLLYVDIVNPIRLGG